MAATKKQFILPSINLPIKIPVNTILGCIYSLLQDQDLMSLENLIFPDPSDPSKVVPFTDEYS